MLHTARVIVCGANLLPVRAGCTFCHEQQKVPKNALHVTFAARTAGGAALSRAATVPLTPFPAKGLCLGRQSRFARMTQDPVIRTGAGNTLKLMQAAQDPWDPAQLGRAESREPSRAIHLPERVFN